MGSCVRVRVRVCEGVCICMSACKGVCVCVNDYKRQVERVESNWKDSLTVKTSREKVTRQFNF